MFGCSKYDTNTTNHPLKPGGFFVFDDTLESDDSGVIVRVDGMDLRNSAAAGHIAAINCLRILLAGSVDNLSWSRARALCDASWMQ